MDELNLYDSINTYAVRWLTYNAKSHGKPLGIKNFNRKNTYHMWFLHMLENYSVFNNYCDYYIDGSFVSYLYLRYIKKFKHLRYTTNSKANLMIDIDIFIKELTNAFHENANIILKIYNEYWGDNR